MKLHAIPSNPVPEGAVCHELVTPDKVRLRHARWNPATTRRGTVVLLNGRTDMIEKYFEVVEELRHRGFAVATLDWRGQGGSERKLPDPRKGHVWSFSEYQSDLETMIREVVLPDCPPPLFALAHSMGAAVLLEAIRGGKRWFDRVVLSAPLIGLQEFRVGGLLQRGAAIATAFGLGRLYVPGGGPLPRASRPFLGNIVTSDPVRYERTASIIEAAPELAVGSPTLAWTNAAFDLMEELKNPVYPTAIRQPMLIVAAGEDRIVSTLATERFSTRLRAGHHLVIAGSRHELLMERDIFRAQFWAAFDAFVPGSPLYR
jgi:lysophospholipase